MQIISFNSKIFIQSQIEDQLLSILDEMNPGSVFVLADENTKKYCIPHLSKLKDRKKVHTLVIGQGEHEKVIKTVVEIWNFLQKNGADRESVMINLGGGMLLDIGGFAASTFKRGLRFINIPTTLLSMVDASVGGKTGINFNDFKNHVGTFAQPEHVLISPRFTETQHIRQVYAGWAEMIKHGLIHSPTHLQNLLDVKPESIKTSELTELIHESVEIKNHFVMEDPYEKNLRKTLNFGHTIGHAFESLAFSKKQSLLHGEAVANGMICELYLSKLYYQNDEDMITKVVEYIRQSFRLVSFSEADYGAVYNFLLQDKKNQEEKINFTLLRRIGEPVIDHYLERNTIEEALDYYRHHTTLNT